MNRCRDDLTLSDALSDPLIRAVMKADGVNAQELGAMLRGVADNLRANAPGRRSFAGTLFGCR